MIILRRFLFVAFGVMAFIGFASSQQVQQAVNSIVATTCSAQFVRSIAATGSATCASVAVATDVSGLGTGVATFLATPSSTNLATVVTDETGSGGLVFGTTPTIVTPIITGNWNVASSQTIGNGAGVRTLALSGGTGSAEGTYISLRPGVNLIGEWGSLNGGPDSGMLFYNSSGSYRFNNMVQTSAAQSGTVCYSSTQGVMTYDATVSCLTSSMQFKHDWKPLTGALDKVLQIEAGSFLYNDQEVVPGEQIGLNAENIALIDPRLVVYSPDGQPRAVRYLNTIALLVKAIQEQQEQIEILKAR